MSTLDNPLYLKGAIPQVVPFTIRENASLLSIIESMRVWIDTDLIPFINENITELSENWNSAVESLSEAWQDAIDTVTAAVDAAVIQANASAASAEAAKVAAEAARDLAEQYASTVESIQDSAITSIFNDTDSQFRTAINAVIGDSVVEDVNDPGTFIVG